MLFSQRCIGKERNWTAVFFYSPYFRLCFELWQMPHGVWNCREKLTSSREYQRADLVYTHMSLGCQETGDNGLFVYSYGASSCQKVFLCLMACGALSRYVNPRLASEPLGVPLPTVKAGQVRSPRQRSRWLTRDPPLPVALTTREPIRLNRKSLVPPLSVQRLLLTYDDSIIKLSSAL